MQKCYVRKRRGDSSKLNYKKKEKHYRMKEIKNFFQEIRNSINAKSARNIFCKDSSGNLVVEQYFEGVLSTEESKQDMNKAQPDRRENIMERRYQHQIKACPICLSLSHFSLFAIF